VAAFCGPGLAFDASNVAGVVLNNAADHLGIGDINVGTDGSSQSVVAETAANSYAMPKKYR